MAPFLALYALWAAWAAELLWKEGGAKFTLIQLVTSLLLAAHVRAAAGRRLPGSPRAAAPRARQRIVHRSSYAVASASRCPPAPAPRVAAAAAAAHRAAPALPAPPRAPQALAYLSTVWSANLKARLHFKPAGDLAEATHVKVVPHAFVGSTEIVPLHGKVTVRAGAACARW